MSADYGTRSPQQVIWLVGAVSLVVVMIVGGGWLALRGTATAAPAPATAAVAPPRATSTDVTPGTIDGVPWGHPLTRDGAVAAALTAVAVTGQAEAVLDPERFQDVAAKVFTPEEATAQVEQVDAARAELEASTWAQQPPSRRMYHFAPLAARLVEFDPTLPSARVEVWSMTLVGVGDAGGAVFTTSTVDLVEDGEAGTWRVAGVETEEGPTPLVQAAASAPGRTRALLRGAVSTMPVPVGQP